MAQCVVSVSPQTAPCAQSVLVVFITLILPQGLVCIYHAANVEVISSLVLGKQTDLYVSV